MTALGQMDDRPPTDVCLQALSAQVSAWQLTSDHEGVRQQARRPHEGRHRQRSLLVGALFGVVGPREAERERTGGASDQLQHLQLKEVLLHRRPCAIIAAHQNTGPQSLRCDGEGVGEDRRFRLLRRDHQVPLVVPDELHTRAGAAEGRAPKTAAAIEGARGAELELGAELARQPLHMPAQELPRGASRREADARPPGGLAVGAGILLWLVWILLPSEVFAPLLRTSGRRGLALASFFTFAGAGTAVAAGVGDGGGVGDGLAPAAALLEAEPQARQEEVPTLGLLHSTGIAPLCDGTPGVGGGALGRGGLGDVVGGALRRRSAACTEIKIIFCFPRPRFQSSGGGPRHFQWKEHLLRLNLCLHVDRGWKGVMMSSSA
mmetsp:Transcript_102202/g.274463  ORF Transcript_102202/g.274463 Transcript_102202/m.274463 type:complete len:377 (+) Transcript_102202:318-1448(+)